jgi:hypothetical protein
VGYIDGAQAFPDAGMLHSLLHLGRYGQQLCPAMGACMKVLGSMHDEPPAG